MEYNNNNNSETIVHKYLLSDVLLELINLGIGENLKIIKEEKFKKLKNKPNENTIFKFIERFLNEENAEDDEKDEEKEIL